MTDDAEAAFGAVADELRVRILRELWDAEDALAFSDLRERLDVRDSGRFNYHLGELRGRFVERTDDGYELRFAGMRLVGALHSGVFTEDVALGPTPVDAECFECGGALEARYEDEHARVRCTDCGLYVLSYGVPPAALDGRGDDFAAAVDRYLRSEMRLCTDGFCPQCSGPTAGTLVDGEFGPLAVFECERCGGEFRGIAPMVALDHAAVVAFYHDHGRDLHATPVWKLPWLYDVEFDGDLAVLTIELDGDELPVRIGPSLSVTTGERA